MNCPPLPRRAGPLCRLALVFALWLPTAWHAQAQPVSPGPAVTAAELDKAAYAFADRYTTQLIAATDALVQGNPSPEQRRAAHLVKLVSVSGIYDIVTNADPFNKLMDLLMVVTLQSYRWIDEDMAERTFGPGRSGPLIQAMRNLRVDIWAVAGRVLRPEQLHQLDALILDWRKRNPHVDILAYLRFDEVAGQRGNPLEEIRASGFFAEIASATKVADDARLLAERAFYQAKRMPFLMSWQMEAMMNDMMVRPEVGQSLRTAESIAQTADRVARAAEKLPQQVAQERAAVLAALEDRNGHLSRTMGELRSTTSAAEQLAARIHQVSQSGERLSLNLRDTARGFTETSNAVNQLLSKHAGGPPKPDAKPFDIEPYMKASAEVNQTVAGLNALLGQTDALVAKKPWAAPMQDAQALLTAQIDHAFWRALTLVVCFFVLLFAYRWASLRWLRPAT